jgi:hypothetical protein
LVKEDKSNNSAKEIVTLMYDTAMLTSGFDVEAPKDYANKVYDMMGMALVPGSAENVPAEKAQAKEALEADQVIEEK